MKCRVLLIPVAFLLLGADAKEEQTLKELKKLEGTWVLVSGERDGTKLSDEHVKTSKITWKGKDCVVESPHQSKEPIKALINGLK